MPTTSRLTGGLAAAITAVALAVVPSAASSAAPAAASSAAAAPSAQDLAYLTFAARSNLAEIALGKLAKRASDSESVRDFARDMIKDHRTLYGSLRATASTLGVALPTRPSRDQRRVARAWSTLDGRAFDCAYVPFEWGDHQLVISTTDLEVQLGSEPTVKQGAAASLPVLQEHLMHATDLLHALHRC
jgi:putative membrane protein